MDTLVKAIEMVIPKGYKTAVGQWATTLSMLWLGFWAVFGEDIAWDPPSWAAKVVLVAGALGAFIAKTGAADKQRRLDAELKKGTVRHVPPPPRSAVQN